MDFKNKKNVAEIEFRTEAVVKIFKSISHCRTCPNLVEILKNCGIKGFLCNLVESLIW